MFANYALHYVGNTGPQVSADYFGEFSRLMPIRLGASSKQFVAMLSNGTSGDINNINFRQPRPRRAVFEQITVVASKTADAVTHAIHAAGKPSAEVVLGMAQREVTLRHRKKKQDKWGAIMPRNKVPIAQKHCDRDYRK